MIQETVNLALERNERGLTARALALLSSALADAPSTIPAAYFLHLQQGAAEKPAPPTVSSPLPTDPRTAASVQAGTCVLNLAHALTQ